MPDTDARDILGVLVNNFEQAEDASLTARKESERNRDYYDSKQLTAAEVSELKKRGQPEIVRNEIRGKINFLKGLEILQRTDPKAYPRTPQHTDDADAATEALRYVADNTKFNKKRSGVWENMLIEGYGGAEVVLDRRGEVAVNRYHWDRLYYDPHSMEMDFSDARFNGSVVWMDYDRAVQRWPHARGVIDATMSWSTSDTYDDKPRFAVWADGKRRRVKIVQQNYMSEQGWASAIFTRGGFMRPPRVSPYLDEHGEPENPLILQASFIDRDNDRYGIVREMMWSQDEVNKRASKALHLFTMRQVVAEKGAVTDTREARRQLARPDGYIETVPDAQFEVIQNQEMAVGHLQLLQEAKEHIRGVGPNQSLQGTSPAISGRHLQTQQQGSMIELNPLAEELDQFSTTAYRQMWNRVRQFWTGERWIRVTDDMDNVRFVGFNQIVSVNGVPVPMNMTAQMDMDIIIDPAPDTITLEHEQFEMLANMASSGVPVPMDMIVEASNLRGDKKRAILERMNQPDPVQQQAAQLEMTDKQADIAKTYSEVDENNANAEKLRAQAMQTQVDTADQLAAPVQ